MRREEGAWASALEVAQVQRDGFGQSEAVPGGGAASDFIQDDEGTARGLVEDARRLRHLHHEGGLALLQKVRCADPREDAVHEAEAHGFGRDEGAGLGQHDQQAAVRRKVDLPPMLGPVTTAMGRASGRSRSLGMHSRSRRLSNIGCRAAVRFKPRSSASSGRVQPRAGPSPQRKRAHPISRALERRRPTRRELRARNPATP